MRLRHDAFGDVTWIDFFLLLEEERERQVLVRNELFDVSEDDAQRSQAQGADVHAQWQWTALHRSSNKLHEDDLSDEGHGDDDPEDRIGAQVLERIGFFFLDHSRVDEVEHLQEDEHVEEVSEVYSLWIVELLISLEVNIVPSCESCLECQESMEKGTAPGEEDRTGTMTGSRLRSRWLG